MPVNYLGDNNPSGSCLGKTTTDKIGFYGTAPIAKATVAVTVTTTASAAAVATDLAALRTALSNLGIIGV